MTDIFDEFEEASQEEVSDVTLKELEGHIS